MISFNLILLYVKDFYYCLVLYLFTSTIYKLTAQYRTQVSKPKQMDEYIIAYQLRIETACLRECG